MKNRPRQVSAAKVVAGKTAVYEMALLDFTPFEGAIFNDEVRKIAIVEQAILEDRGEKGLFAPEKLGSHDLAFDKLHILQPAAIQFNKAQVAVYKGA